MKEKIKVQKAKEIKKSLKGYKFALCACPTKLFKVTRRVSFYLQMKFCASWLESLEKRARNVFAELKQVRVQETFM